MKLLRLKRGLGLETKIELEEKQFEEKKIIFSGIQKEKIILNSFVNLTIIIENNSKIELELIQENKGNYREKINVILNKNSVAKIAYLQKDGTVYSEKKFVLERNSELFFEERNYGVKTVSHSKFNLKKDSKLRVISKHIGKKQEYDSTLEVIHEEKSFSVLESRNLLKDSTALTRGIIRVLKNAAGTETKYLSKNIIFGNSSANAIPELDIHNENIICKHGATIETITEEQMYYLMSRGLSKTKSIEVFTSGLFGKEV
jgi:Fe-S cluster assembly scaffold protein SufB